MQYLFYQGVPGKIVSKGQSYKDIHMTTQQTNIKHNLEKKTIQILVSY